MELQFISKALRKRWWMVLAFAALGVVLASRVAATGPETYESTSLVLVQPSVDSVSPSLSNLPDRYVQGQISVLESTVIAERVAASLGGDETAASVRRSVEFNQREDSDIVEVVATTGNADRSQQIAQVYATTYVADVVSRTDAVFQPERDRLQAELATVETELADVNTDLARAAAPYIATLGTETPVPVPDIRVLDPDAATRQTLLLSDLERIAGQLDALELTASQAVQTEIVQQAQVPTGPVATATGLLRIAIVAIFAMLGVVAALSTARFSTNVIDDRDIEDRLGQPIEARLPRVKSLTFGPEAAIREDDLRFVQGLDRLSGRIELASLAPGARVVIVGGSHEGAGSTTTAVGLAARFATRGHRTIIIDADGRSAALTGALDAPAGQLADVAAAIPPELGQTELPNLITMGISPALTAQRLDGEEIVGALRRAADVVIIDVGPMLESMSASALAGHVDQVVLVLSATRQSQDEVDQLARVFSSIADRVIPVVADAPAGRRSSSRPTMAPSAESPTAAADLEAAA